MCDIFPKTSYVLSECSSFKDILRTFCLLSCIRFPLLFKYSHLIQMLCGQKKFFLKETFVFQAFLHKLDLDG